MPVPEKEFNCMFPGRDIDARAIPFELLSVEAGADFSLPFGAIISKSCVEDPTTSA